MNLHVLLWAHWEVPPTIAAGLVGLLAAYLLGLGPWRAEESRIERIPRLQVTAFLAGLLTLFVSHTSASLTIQENADPNVRHDLITALEAFAPEDANYTHAEEGPDDMPSHIKSMLTEVSLSIPVMDGRMTLGTWQGVYLIEHRAAPHERKIALSFIGHAGA